ncbi:MAG: sugar transferase [Sphingobacteriaceae bacterium]|nr:sugar transferase [Sphingobacteriaceae bacterium]
MKRVFDILFSLCGIVILLPVFILILVLILLNDGWPVLYRQVRVGQCNQDFTLIKFRTMRKNSDLLGLLTVGGRDPRVTAIGYYLRKYKLDELPQLFNVLMGQMSLVGPRPEVRKYVQLYTDEQLKILNVKPGITDYASLEYYNENELLAKSANPEKTYIDEVMPAKLNLNKKYVEEAGVLIDLKIIFLTIKKILA